MGHHLTATILFLLGGAIITSAAFVRTPTSVNATLESTASFSCSTNATRVSLVWLVNGLELRELNQSETTTINRTTHLRLPATEEYNNTVVVCKVIIRNSSNVSIETSDPAVLRVQGLLDAVNNFKSESLGQVIHLTWNAPFSLDITGVDPDIWYRVEITVSDGPLNTHFASRIINIPEFNFTMNDHTTTSTSVVYEFQVTPINGAGNGTTSSAVTGYFIGPPAPRSITQDMVVASSSADPLNVNLTITYGNIPLGETPDQIQIFAETVDDGNKVFYCTNDIPVMPDSDGRVLIQLNTSTPTCTPGSYSLEPHRSYRAIIAAKNQAGQINSTGNICFCTCETQICTASVIDGSRPKAVNISCKFTEAMGYLLIFSPQTNSSQKMFVIASKVNTSNSNWKISIPMVPHDNYAVFRYDLRSIGLPMSSDDSTGDRLYVPASGKENVTVMDSRESTCENESISAMDEGNAGSSEVLLVPGTMLEVPDIADADVKLCVSIKPDPSSDTIIVLAYHNDDPEKLLAYFLDVTNCTTALAPGSYFFGVFVQNEDKIVKEPVTPPTIFFNTVSITSSIPPVLPTNTYDSPLLLVVVTVIVAVSALLVTVTVVVTVAVCVKTKVKKEKLKEEIEMRPNQAYETVSRPHPSGSATQIHTERCVAYDDVIVQACN